MAVLEVEFWATERCNMGDLYAGESGTIVQGKSTGIEKKLKAVVAATDYYGPSGMTDVVEEQTQDTLSSMVSLLQEGFERLNNEIKMVNVQRMADAEAMQVDISKMEDEVNRRFDDNDIILTSFTKSKC